MAVVYVNPIYPFQVAGGSVQAPSTQLNYRQMLSEVVSWNPNLDPMIAGRFINNYYRKIIDMRSWYALKLRGQINVRAPYNTGQVTTISGSPFVQGINTNWTQAAINGMQFRVGFTSAYQGVTNVNEATQVLQLDTPFAGTGGTTGYQMTDCLIDFGGNIKRILWAVNQQQGWPMIVNASVESINSWDTWRTNLGWSKYFATRSQSPSGSLINECWPSPASAQAFPFEAYQQAPDLVNDNDAPVAWIRSDIIVTRAVADALLKGGRKSEYYDPVVAGMKIKEFDDAVEQMTGADDNLDIQDVTWDFGDEGGESDGHGSYWSQSHA